MGDQLIVGILVSLLGTILTTGIGFTIWLIRQHITDSNATGDLLTEKVNKLDVTTEVTKQALDDHIEKGDDQLDRLIERLDRHIDES